MTTSTARRRAFPRASWLLGMGRATLPPLVAGALAAALALAPGADATASTAVVNAENVQCPAAVTSDCVTVGNVSTTGGVIPNLFKGALVGTDAYLSYLDTTKGGVNGHKIALLSADDELNGDNNRVETQDFIGRVLALVGSYSLDDEDGATVLAQHPDVPNVSESISLYAQSLSNTFPVAPISDGWTQAGLEYFAKHDSTATKHVGLLIAQESSAEAQATALEGAMHHAGFKVVYSSPIGPLDTQFTAQVLAMKHAGVQYVDLTVMDVTDAEAIVKEMHQQDFHPTVVVSEGPTYTDGFVQGVGGASLADGIWLDQGYPLYLGQDAKNISEDKTMLTWVQKVQPGWTPDLWTLFGWTEAQLFAQALTATGSNPTQSALLSELKSIHTFTAGGLLPPADLQTKHPSACIVMARIEHGQYVRVAPSPKTGFDCSVPYYLPS